MRKDGRTIKFSSKCGWPEGCRKTALRRQQGFDTYCRDHKRQCAREYMRERRVEDPSYGQGRYR